MLFFVLSGYLLSMPITSGKQFDFQTYILRRFLRIAPLYYLVITSTYLYQQYTNHISDSYLHINDGLHGFIKHVFFIKGDSLFWTISAEFIFYLILPVLAIYLIKQRYKAVFVLVIASASYSFYHFLIYANILHFPGLKIVDINHVSQFFDVFIVGVIFGFLSHDNSAKSFYRRYSRILDVLALNVFIATMLITFILISKHFLVFDQPLYLCRFISFGYASSFGFILLSTHYGNIKLRKIFQLKIFMFCGVVGYSWYLLHFPVLAFTSGLSFPPPVKLLVSTALISIISLAGYLYIEEPFIKLGKSLTLKSLTKTCTRKK